MLDCRNSCCDGVSYLDDIETDDELMLCSKNMRHPAAAPGDYMWMRFPCPPTPPKSPTKSFGEPSQNYSTVVERLILVSESLDDFIGETKLLNSISLRSNLIQDCMWNGLKPDDSLGASSESIYETPCSTPPPLDYSSNDCVDPSAVFPYPLNENGSSQPEDTDEEIDVVSLDKPELKRKLSEPIFSGCKEPKFKRTRSLPSKTSGRSHKRTFDDVSSDSSPRVIREIRQSEESDTDKRASHNVLERKRRNDLKSSFHTLRSYVPALCNIDKAAKVIILKKATDYIHELKKAEDVLEKEKDELKTRQRELLERFIKLKPKAK